MDDPGPQPLPPGDGDDARQRRRRILKIVGGVTLVLVLVVAAGATIAYRRLNGNLRSIDPTKELGTDRPPSFPGALNILVIGTDSREGLGNRYGDAGSVGHADTNLLFHVSADRSNASVISIPRDLMVRIPTCLSDRDQPIPGAARAMFNIALGQDGRGPGCVMKTVEKLTGIRVDHFVMVDFQGVKKVTSALGGVEICTANQIDDVKSGLHLPPGRHKLEGERALAFLRTRHGVGFGSDLDRIKLQQQFLSSMIRGIRSAGTLTNPPRLFKIADAATDALTVDEDIASIRSLTALALDINHVPSKRISFATVPVLDSPFPGEENRLVLLEPRAEDLFRWVGADRSLSRGGAPGSTASATPGGPSTSPPAHPAGPTGTPTSSSTAAPSSAPSSGPPEGVDVVRASTRACAG